jgi:hypothetical protein
MNCPQCNQSVTDTAGFCANCGQRLNGALGSGPGTIAATGANMGHGLAPDLGVRAHPGMSGQQAGPQFLERVKNILSNPVAEWSVIDAERSTVGQLYSGYVVPMAAFVAVMSLIRLCVTGVSVPSGDTIRLPLVSGLVSAIVAFVLGLIGLVLVGYIIDVLAPTFTGQRNHRQAMKTAAYAFTPSWLGTALTFLPLGPVLQLAAAMYGIYLLHLGLPVLMRVKPDKATGYTATVVICTFGIGILFAFLTAALVGAIRN